MMKHKYDSSKCINLGILFKTSSSHIIFRQSDKGVSSSSVVLTYKPDSTHTVAKLLSTSMVCVFPFRVGHMLDSARTHSPFSRQKGVDTFPAAANSYAAQI